MSCDTSSTMKRPNANQLLQWACLTFFFLFHQLKYIEDVELELLVFHKSSNHGNERPAYENLNATFWFKFECRHFILRFC